MAARMHPFVVGSQRAEQRGAPRAHLARGDGGVRGWCLARRVRRRDCDTTTNGATVGFARTGRNKANTASTGGLLRGECESGTGGGIMVQQACLRPESSHG